VNGEARSGPGRASETPWSHGMVSVTIGLPVYNGADYLEQALASLLAQSMRDIQFLISDNASTDATPDILAKWMAKDSRIKYRRQPQNIGASANFNWVLDNAGSQWFAFAAHDDLWSPNFVESLFHTITAKPGLVLAVPQVVTMFEDRREDARRPVPEEMTTGSRVDLIRRALQEVCGGWFYGLWNRQTLISAFQQTRNFTHVFGADLLILLPPILSGAIAGSNKAIFYERLTTLSVQRYRPKTAKGEYVFYCDFLKECLKALKAAPLSQTEKFLVLPSVLRHVRRGIPLRSILKNAVREALDVLRVKKRKCA